MAKRNSNKQLYITDTPLTTEAREALLYDLFAGHLPHMGELFISDDGFYYIKDRGPAQARHMLAVLCKWLGVKPGYIGLEFESAGGDIPDGRRYTIYIESSALWDEFLLGAYLAYSLTRYLIIERKQISLPPDDEAAMLANASIVFGLGLVIANGLSPHYSWIDSWLQKIRAPNTPLLHSYPEANYMQMLQAFIIKHRVSPLAFQSCLTPWATKRAGKTLPRQSSSAVMETRHKIHAANTKLVGVLWLATMIIGLGIFVMASHTRPESAKIIEARDKAALLTNLTLQCKESLEYEHLYADSADIQTLRNLNAVNLRCQSLSNQQAAAEHDYQALLESKN